MRGHTQLPMVAPGWMSPQGGTAGRANPTTRLQDGGVTPILTSVLILIPPNPDPQP